MISYYASFRADIDVGRAYLRDIHLIGIVYHAHQVQCKVIFTRLYMHVRR
jgi:hypothetical protein